MSHIGGVGPSKTDENFPLFEKFPTEGGGGGFLKRLGLFPNFYRFLNYDSFPYFVLNNPNDHTTNQKVKLEK